ASGGVTAFGLLATTEVFTVLLRDGPTPQRLVTSLPAVLVVVVVVGSYAIRALLDTAVAAVEGALRPMVTRAAEDEVTATVARMSLISFEDADFQELARRAGTDGLESIGAGVRTASAALTECLRAVNLLHEDSHHVELYRRLLDDGVLQRSPETGVQAPADPQVITMSGVSFTYLGQSRPALRDLDLTINRG
ncbi:MAG: hypothetical protein ABIQ18_13675, partial [Umezawaea sp.]